MLLWLQGLIFTVLVPGVVAFYVPQTMHRGPAPAYADYRRRIPRWLGPAKALTRH